HRNGPVRAATGCPLRPPRSQARRPAMRRESPGQGRQLGEGYTVAWDAPRVLSPASVLLRARNDRPAPVLAPIASVGKITSNTGRIMISRSRGLRRLVPARWRGSRPEPLV